MGFQISPPCLDVCVAGFGIGGPCRAPSILHVSVIWEKELLEAQVPIAPEGHARRKSDPRKLT